MVGEDRRVIGAGMLQELSRKPTDIVGKRSWALYGASRRPRHRDRWPFDEAYAGHRYAVLRSSDTEEDYIAHVVDGNRGPIHALLAAGFEDLGPMKLHPGEFDGHVEHMMAPGENYVPMHAYRFNRDTIDNLIRDLWSFWHGGGELSRPDRNLRVKVDFSDMVDPAFLDAEVEASTDSADRISTSDASLRHERAGEIDRPHALGWRVLSYPRRPLEP